MIDEPRRRSEDSGWVTRFYDWIDQRQVDKHFVSLAILFGTIRITEWAMSYASGSARPGLEIAAIIAAVTAPYMALQAAAVGFYFNYRK